MVSPRALQTITSLLLRGQNKKIQYSLHTSVTLPNIFKNAVLIFSSHTKDIINGFHVLIFHHTQRLFIFISVFFCRFSSNKTGTKHLLMTWSLTCNFADIFQCKWHPSSAVDSLLSGPFYFYMWRLQSPSTGNLTRRVVIQDTADRANVGASHKYLCALFSDSSVLLSPSTGNPT